MLDQNAKKLFIDFISYKVNWYKSGVYFNEPDTLFALEDVLRQATDGRLDWAFDYDNLYEDDDHPEYKYYEDLLPLFKKEISYLKSQIDKSEKKFKKDSKHLTGEEYTKCSDHHYAEYVSMKKTIDGYRAASDFHNMIVYSLYYRL